MINILYIYVIIYSKFVPQFLHFQTFFFQFFLQRKIATLIDNNTILIDNFER